MNAKVDVTSNVQFPGTEGQPYFVLTDSQSLLMGRDLGNTAIADNREFKKFADIYSYFRLRGIRIEVMPSAFNINNDSNNYTGGIYIGFGVQGNEENLFNYDIMSKSPQAFMVNPMAKSVKYWNLYGAQDDWKLVSGDFNGRIFICASNGGTNGTAPEFTVKVTYYLSFKQQKL